jgi:hypothetical protein
MAKISGKCQIYFLASNLKTEERIRKITEFIFLNFSHQIWGIISVVYFSQHFNNYHQFYIGQIFELKWDYAEAVHQLFIDFKNS